MTAPKSILDDNKTNVHLLVDFSTGLFELVVRYAVHLWPLWQTIVVGICMVLEQSLVEVCLKGLNGVSMCPVVWEWCMNACEKSVRWCLHVCENMSVRMIV